MSTDAHEQVRVELSGQSYTIAIGDGLLTQAADYIAPLLSRPFTVIVCDETVATHHLNTLTAALEKAGIAASAITLAPGENSKSWDGLQHLLAQLFEAKVERGDTIIALGGGVIGDLTGFAASIFRRGIAFIQIPTTLLAQVDSSVGGKTGINTPFGKNLVGSFHQPALVLADTGLLDTLPPRQVRSGYAEVVKYGIIDDAEFFDWLEQHGSDLLAGNTNARQYAIAVSCRNKAAVVAADERETGKRALLNLGHTFGHALEAETGYSDRLTHGEGVAIGMVLAMNLSVRMGLCDKTEAERVEAHLRGCGLPARLADIIGAPVDIDHLVRHMAQDKKVKDGTINYVLARRIGKAFLTDEVDEADMRAVLAASLS